VREVGYLQELKYLILVVLPFLYILVVISFPNSAALLLSFLYMLSFLPVLIGKVTCLFTHHFQICFTCPPCSNSSSVATIIRRDTDTITCYGNEQ